MHKVEKSRKAVFQDVYGVKFFSEILVLFEKDYNRCKNKGLDKVQSLFKNYSYAIFYMYSPSSIRNNLVKFKNIIKKNGGKYESNALHFFDIDNIYKPVKINDLKIKKNLKEKLRHNENSQIDPSCIIDEITLLADILNNKTYQISSNQKEVQVRAYHILALLGLSTGRRFTELMKTLVIKKRGTKITFDGLLKGNDEPIEGKIIELSYKEVQKYLKELRLFAMTDELTEQEVNAKYARVFNNALKRLGYTNVKSLRQNYSMAGSQLFKKDGESIEDTITRILGHKEIFTSALNYTFAD